MPFTFVHTADWQIGRPFRGFGERVGAVLEDARLAAIDSIAAAARAAGARHVLVAGDVLDSETLPRKALWPAFERMARCPDLSWHLIPGNHDPARPGGLWHRVMSYSLPPHVTVHLEPRPCLLAPDVVLLPAVLTAKSSSTDPTAWMDGTATPAGALRLGLAHGSVQDFARAEVGGIIDPARARKAGLGYLALGDWHGCQQIGPATWYAGTPEPDRYGDASAGQVLVVRAATGAAPEVTQVRTGHFSWVDETVALASASELDALEARLVGLAPSADRLLLALTLTGAVPPDTHAALQPWRERLESRVRHLRLDTQRLTTRATAAELAGLFTDPRLQTVAERLARLAADSADPNRAAADRALLMLCELAQTDAGPADARNTEAA